MPATQLSADEDNGTLTAATQNFTLKSGVDESGTERDFVEGFLATTHVDKGNDEFTEEALKGMAEDINDKTVDAIFNDVDEEELEKAMAESQVGNLDHNNNPVAPFGDTRTVPAFKVQRAEVRDTGDGETGLWVKGMLNTGGMLDSTVSAVKNSIQDGFLNAFSVEFIPEKVRQVKRGERIVRIIEEAKATGAALTGRPMNPAARMTDAMLKSVTADYIDETEIKQDYSIQTPDYEATSEASWEKPAAGDFPDDYDVMSIFLARNRESENFSDQALPVVDWRNGEATLVLEALRSAHQLASRVDGLSEEEVSQARDMVEELAQKEFDTDISSEEGDAQHMDEESKNDTTTMTDEQPESEGEPEDGEPEDAQGQEQSPEGSETKSLQEDVKELKSQFEEVKETNKSLKEENEDLKSELEDLKSLQEVKNDLEEVKGMLDDVELEDGPRSEQEQKRFEDEDDTPQWKKSIDGMQDAKSFFKNDKMYESFAETKNVDVKEVKNYVNED